MSKDNRQYRSFAATNFAPVEDAEKHPYTVRGYFTTFEDPYTLFEDTDGIEYKEVIDRDAFAGCDLADVIFQFDHQGTPLARQRNKTLEVGFDDHGGWCQARLDGCQQARDLYEAITNGLVDRMSFGFTIGDSDYDAAAHTSRVTRINKLYDVSAVSIPANPGTEISARSYLDGAIEAAKQELLASDRERRKRIAAAMELSTLHH